MNVCIMTYRYSFSYAGYVIAIAVNDTAVLNISAASYSNLVNIPSDYNIIPDAAVITNKTSSYNGLFYA